MDNAILWMSEYTAAIEASDQLDAVEIAVESTREERIAEIGKDFNDKLATAYADFTTAYKAQDKNKCLETLDKIIQLNEDAKTATRSVEPDKWRVLRRIGKVVACIIGIAAFIKSETILAAALNMLSNGFGITSKMILRFLNPTTTAGKVGMNAGLLIGNIMIGYVGLKPITSAVSHAIQNSVYRKIGGSKSDFESKYGKDKNASNAFYRASITVYDESIKLAKQLKSEVASGNFNRDV